MLIKKLVLTAGFLAISSAAQADTVIPGGQLYVTQTGTVTATFVPLSGGYVDVLFFDNGTPLELFNSHTTADGSSVDLGVINAGTLLNFRMHVNDTGDDYVMGPASANVDNTIHAIVTLNSNHVATVGFEDLPDGGDKNYTDLVFTVSNVSAVPEPAAYGMLLGGLGVLGLLARRRKFS